MEKDGSESLFPFASYGEVFFSALRLSEVLLWSGMDVETQENAS